MKDLSIQNFTFSKGKIFPNDWLQTKPYSFSDAIDSYYVSVANRVAAIIQSSEFGTVFGEKREDILHAAICITGWFEDICSDLGIWRVVGDECLARYGTVLPFYDVRKYERGIVNPEDLMLLVWDLAQSAREKEGKIVNPENPYLQKLAWNLYDFLFDEYDIAPQNDRLYDYVHNPEASDNLWLARELISWLSYRSYIGHRTRATICESRKKARKDKDMKRPEMDYGISSMISIISKENILSLSAPHFLSRIRGVSERDDAFETIEYTQMEPWLFLGFRGDDMLLRNLYNDREIVLDSYSMNLEAMKKSDYVPDKTLITCQVLKFNGKNCLCGVMVSGDYTAEGKAKVEKDRNNLELRNSQQDMYDDFMKLTGGKRYIVVPDMESLTDFHNKLFKESGPNEKNFPPEIRNGKNFLLFVTPSNGFITIPEIGVCIASKTNPCYDKQAAKEKALDLIVNRTCVPYPLSRMLLADGVLPDAFLNSIKGPVHGRSFFQKNVRFFADYFHQATMEYDFDKYDVNMQ